MRFFFTILFIFLPNIFFSFYLPLKTNSLGKIEKFEWNFQTPIALPTDIGEHIEISIILPDKTTIKLHKENSKDLENYNHYIFYLNQAQNPLTNTEKITIHFYNKQKLWPFRSQKINLTKNIKIPKLNIISASADITHGGSGIIVIESEPSKQLSLLAFIDEKNIPFYPQTFIKDGFYTILFPWYTEHSQKWENNFIIVMDKAGNTNTLPLNNINAKNTKYRERIITLPNDYADQKAKELALSTADAKKLEGNIQEINKALAMQTTFERWKKTRTSFKENIKNIISNTSVFSAPSVPMQKAIHTAFYGDRRKYFYKKSLVRQSIHKGLDYASYKNTPIFALLDGTVLYADWYGGNGKSVIIDHGFNLYSLYAHNSELLVKSGQKVSAGTQISISGTTGQSTGDHLHLSLFIQGMFINPQEWLTSDSITTIFHKPLQEAENYILGQE